MIYLCPVDKAFADKLNASNVPEDLQRKLNQGELFPSSCTLKVNQPSCQWTIVNGEKTYFIREENDTLNVYLAIVKEHKQILVWGESGGSIFGQVIDKQMKKPIAGAQVRIEQTEPFFANWLALKQLQYGAQWQKMSQRPDRTLTTAEGHYHFIGLPNRDISVKVYVTAPGFKSPAEKDVKLLGAKRWIQVENFELEADAKDK